MGVCKQTQSLHANTLAPAALHTLQIKTDVVKGTTEPKFLKDCRLVVPSPETDTLRVRISGRHGLLRVVGGNGAWGCRTYMSCRCPKKQKCLCTIRLHMLRRLR